MKPLLPLVCYLVFGLHGFSQVDQSRIDKKDLRTFVKILTADSLQGRGTGTEGQKKAEVFIANRFKALGLIPCNSNGYLEKFKLNQTHWGQVYIRTQQATLDNHTLLSKALLISSSVGYWNALASPYKYFTLFLWHVVVPITSATVGYVPASWFGLGEDLPKGVARDWRHWCLQPDYYRSYLGTIVPHHYFDSVTLPLHFLFPEDDTIVTDRSVEGLTRFYTSAPITVEKLTLADFGLAKVGHLGYFSRRVKDSLWPKTISFLEG